MPQGVYKRKIGYHLSEEHKKHISEHHKRAGLGIGRKMSTEAKRKMSEAKRGDNNPNKRNELRENRRKLFSGSGNPNWKGGVGRKCTYKHINDSFYKEWRAKVFQRDNWICQTCGIRSSEGVQVYLQAHHIKKWNDYPEFRYDVDNGITLCKECHFNLHFNNKNNDK